ncbi:MAG: hypothetical protein ACRDRU_22055 [Pseudonocardiaceae bacterium]
MLTELGREHYPELDIPATASQELRTRHTPPPGQQAAAQSRER